LLVSFDENGNVRKKELINEDKSLWVELHSRLADAPPLDLSQPIPIEVLGPGKLQATTLQRSSASPKSKSYKTAQTASAGHENTVACAGERNTCGRIVSTSFTATRYTINPAYTARDTRNVRVMRHFF
jgi:hypothetical protein